MSEDQKQPEPKPQTSIPKKWDPIEMPRRDQFPSREMWRAAMRSWENRMKAAAARLARPPLVRLLELEKSHNQNTAALAAAIHQLQEEQERVRKILAANGMEEGGLIVVPGRKRG